MKRGRKEKRGCHHVATHMSRKKKRLKREEKKVLLSFRTKAETN